MSLTQFKQVQEWNQINRTRSQKKEVVSTVEEKRRKDFFKKISGVLKKKLADARQPGKRNEACQRKALT